MSIASHRRVATVWLALILLMLLSVGSAYLPLAGWNLALGLAIAALKAGLVLGCFMKFGRASTLLRLALAASLFALMLLTSLSALDGLTRAAEPSTTQPPRQLPPLLGASPMRVP